MTTQSASTPVRPLHVIAAEIKANWKNVYFGAEPYIAAMAQLDAITDNFYEDDGRSVVRYFLSNATYWRGDVAKRVKAELKGMLS